MEWSISCRVRTASIEVPVSILDNECPWALWMLYKTIGNINLGSGMPHYIYPLTGALRSKSNNLAQRIF